MKILTGKVVSDKMKDTVVVEISWSIAHPMYQKRMHRSKKVHAHNTIGAKTGNLVRLIEIAPMSRTKNWKVEAVI